jgi:hypothetical protein
MVISNSTIWRVEIQIPIPIATVRRTEMATVFDRTTVHIWFDCDVFKSGNKLED